jgi:hypothetical protein
MRKAMDEKLKEAGRKAIPPLPEEHDEDNGV